MTRPTQPVTASEARANLYRLISVDAWDAIQETLYRLSAPGMRESIKQGIDEPLAKSAKALKW